ncbi:lytic transglycosylase domain-containing protein [Chelativorans sp. YIM 93263]
MKRVLTAGDATAQRQHRTRLRTPEQASATDTSSTTAENAISDEDESTAEKAADVVDAKETAVEVASLATAAPKQDPRPFHEIISRYAKEHGVPVSLAHAIVRIESNYRKSARGRAGEVGLMQIKPRTARGVGFRGSAEALYDPENNIKYGMLYLAKAYQLSGGDTCGTILRYNAGHGAKRMNSVSSAYCQKVQRILGNQ